MKKNESSLKLKVYLISSLLFFFHFLLQAQKRGIVTDKFVEQQEQGNSSGLELLTSFNGLGYGFIGPQGTTNLKNPSDNSIAVGLNHIVQTVNSRMAIFTKKGKKFTETGTVLYGPVETKNVFRGFGGPCEQFNNGDAVVRYDQLADRWLLLMPTFRRAPLRNASADITGKWLPQPGEPMPLFQPPLINQDEPIPNIKLPMDIVGSYCMCYAISTGPDPLGDWYRYEFKRDLFPDYPRPAIWNDGYYTTTSTGDHVNERHAYVADRNNMLKGLPATEQHFILPNVNFIINADVDGKALPPSGSPAILMATGGDQLNQNTDDDGIYVWQHYVNWEFPEKSRLNGPKKIDVAPYQYLGGGQLTKAVPQPDTDIRLDAQGDKLMARLVYRRFGSNERIVGVHSVATTSGQGGVRWYEFGVNPDRSINLIQQGTYAPGRGYRWMASPAIDKDGNIGIGYSFSDSLHYPGQRFAGKTNHGQPGLLDVQEIVLVEGEASQVNTLRWQDYTQTALDPTDDKTIWYVGDYLKKDASEYSTRISAIRFKTSKRFRKMKKQKEA